MAFPFALISGSAASGLVMQARLKATLIRLPRQMSDVKKPQGGRQEGVI